MPLAVSLTIDRAAVLAVSLAVHRTTAPPGAQRRRDVNERREDDLVVHIFVGRDHKAILVELWSSPPHERGHLHYDVPAALALQFVRGAGAVRSRAIT
jgi:hypothetical protein